MSASPPQILELAKQGNVTAIAALMNRHLHARGITATTTLDNGCLEVRLEAEPAPNQPTLVEFVRRGITNLGVDAIKTVKLYGMQTGNPTPVWEQNLELSPASAREFYESAVTNTAPDSSATDTATEAEIDQVDQDRADAPLYSSSFPNGAASSNGEVVVLLDQKEFDQPDTAEGRKTDLLTLLRQNWKAIPLMLIAALVGFFLVVFIASRTQRPQPTPGPTSTLPSDPSQPPASPASPASSSTGAPSSQVSPIAITTNTLFDQALASGLSAAVQTQTAVTKAEWDTVVASWQEAIELLKQVPITDPNHATAQQKIKEYQQNLTYAQGKAAAAQP